MFHIRRVETSMDLLHSATGFNVESANGFIVEDGCIDCVRASGREDEVRAASVLFRDRFQTSGVC